MNNLVKIYARPKLNSPVMLASWPGISNVSIILATYLERKLNFKKLAEHNISEIKKSGAKKIIFSCPEGYRTFKIDYQKYFNSDFEVKHITEIISEAISNDKLKFKNLKGAVTFQDPCRLGRHLGIYDEPRKALNAVPELELNEMTRSRNRAICCGVSAWMNCSTYSKSIQRARLKEAKQTKADKLVLSCPKCEMGTSFKTSIQS